MSVNLLKEGHTNLIYLIHLQESCKIFCVASSLILMLVRIAILHESEMKAMSGESVGL